ncbi:hypothetical protein BU24DRAFT_395691 [Aaosphaeria arxii CBS 175.79]|uniref:Macro domain-containing protein n=1 Tax=Aaosphaeria arxii CBS 175.79 TaxID=1450172 RepID=A0A6A5XK22_9PLEO|nr:uncharacterized protein BU24DRAFT_395691 [Aaosphaeria arxii CBS 175.79]KAF2012654.1 hypothetical protein BU24DRAFT_395691 [Aaosphaeria arxii CBS 175.79]
MAASILNSSVKVVRGFQDLLGTLADSNPSLGLDTGLLEDEFGRFRVWSGNLGALQKGHSSLDYRLRESPLLSSNTLKLLSELEENLSEALAVVSGSRLPYEQQVASAEPDEDEDQDDFFSEDEDEEGDDSNNPTPPMTELEQRFLDVVDIIDNLYKLSVRIRQPTLRNRSLKAASYRPKDPETGVDILEQYAQWDLLHTRELITSLREGRTSQVQIENDALVDHLSFAVTLRRRQFKYWKRHRDKLAVPVMHETPAHNITPVVDRPDIPLQQDSAQPKIENPAITALKPTSSEKTGRTLLSGTEVTQHHQSLDEIIDSKSVTSYATTVRDLTGRGIELPPPPKSAHGDKDFECPYCFIICPARYGRGRSWRSHLLQDLQPYICTYSECDSPTQLFRSRREWSEHEASHRKAWRCPEHPNAVFANASGLETHLRQSHANSILESQIETIVKVGETSTIDSRESCPICLVKADAEGIGDGLQNHVANHLERIATFALPSSDSAGDDSDGGSSVASRGRSQSTTSSQDLGTLASYSTGGDISEAHPSDPVSTDVVIDRPVAEGQGLLSADALNSVPDSSSNRLDILLSQQKDGPTNEPEEPVEGSEKRDEEENKETVRVFTQHVLSFRGAEFRGMSLAPRSGYWDGSVQFSNEPCAKSAMEGFNASMFQDLVIRRANKTLNFTFKCLNRNPPVKPDVKEAYAEGNADINALSTSSQVDFDLYSNAHLDDTSATPILTLDEIPTIQSLYTTGKLQQKDQSYAPDVAYNRIVSLCLHDITRIQVDAIVNSANKANSFMKGNDTLNSRIHIAAGPGLQRECREVGGMEEGGAKRTLGYDLPCSQIIHTAVPTYSNANAAAKIKALTGCYTASLSLASQYSIKSLAFPSLASAGRGFPPRAAARIALQTLRDYLDSNPAHGFERVVFVLYTRLDTRAYEDLIPYYFPPTHSDIERAARVKSNARSYVEMGHQIRSVHEQSQKMIESLVDLGEKIPEFDLFKNPLVQSMLDRIEIMKNFFLTRNGPISGSVAARISDLDLICAVLQQCCGGVAELVERAKDGHSTPKALWEEYNFHMRVSQSLDLKGLLNLCSEFMECLIESVINYRPDTVQMTAVRTSLEKYHTRHTGNSGEDAMDKFEEVMYTREFHRDPLPHTRADTITIHQIPTLARLYQTSELEPMPTKSIPDNNLNYGVCFIRESITRIECDAIVNSTDTGFTGMGTLDRTIFKKAGLAMDEACSKFTDLQQGDVRVTPGFALPCRHVIHVIPPKVYRKDTKDLLRQIYREILWTATSLKARSLAIPTIGTGTLNYPSRDCASLAIEEVKRFMETVNFNTRIETIIFVVYSSSDEAIYKSLLPVFFPPEEGNLNKAIREARTSPAPGNDSTIISVSTPGDAIKPKLSSSATDEAQSKATSGKDVSISRTGSPELEKPSLFEFEGHARTCLTCLNMSALYDNGETLCKIGYTAAQKILRRYTVVNGCIQDLITGEQRSQHNSDSFSKFLALHRMFRKSYQDEGRTQPFVSLDISFEDLVARIQSQIPHTSHVTPLDESHATSSAVTPTEHHAVIFDDEYDSASQLSPYACRIIIRPGSADVVAPEDASDISPPPMMLELTQSVNIQKVTDTEILVHDVKRGRDIFFRSQTPAASNTLIESLWHARTFQSTRDNPTPILVQERVRAGESSQWSDVESFLRQRWPEVTDFNEQFVGDSWVFEVPEKLTMEEHNTIHTLMGHGRRPSNSSDDSSGPVSPQHYFRRKDVEHSRPKPSLLTKQLHASDIEDAHPRRIGTPERELSTLDCRESMSRLNIPMSGRYEYLIKRLLQPFRGEDSYSLQERIRYIAKKNEVDPFLLARTYTDMVNSKKLVETEADNTAAEASSPKPGHEVSTATSQPGSVENQQYKGNDSIRSMPRRGPPLAERPHAFDIYHDANEPKEHDVEPSVDVGGIPAEPSEVPIEQPYLRRQLPIDESLAEKTILDSIHIWELLSSLPFKTEGYHQDDIAQKLNLDPASMARAGKHLQMQKTIYTPVDDFHWRLTGTRDISLDPGDVNESTFEHTEQKKQEEEEGEQYPNAMPSAHAMHEYVSYLRSPEADSEIASPVEDMVRNPRPTTPDPDQADPIPPGSRWTKIKKQLVDPQTLIDSGIEFEEQGDSVVAFEVLSADTITRLAVETRNNRIAEVLLENERKEMQGKDGTVDE